MGRPIAAEPPESVELVVVAELLDKAPCPNSGDQIHYGLVMKYELKEIVSMKGSIDCPSGFPNQILYVVHGAPEIPRRSYHNFGGTLDSFEVGDVHEMRLKRKLANNHTPFDVVIDPYIFEDNSPRFLCLKVRNIAENGVWSPVSDWSISIRM